MSFSHNIKVGDLVSYRSTGRLKMYGVITNIDTILSPDRPRFWASWRDTEEQALRCSGMEYEKLFVTLFDRIELVTTYDEEAIWE